MPDHALATAAFDEFPYGVLVVDGAGNAVTANKRFWEFRPPTDESGTALRCCSIFGCRRAGTPLEQGCLTEMAMEARAPLPEMRLDIDNASIAAAWVVAAPISGDNVVFQVRPGDPGDRRRRTEPHWLRGPSLRVQALGHVVVESDGGTLSGQWLDQRPGQLLRYLISQRRRVVHIEEISEALWPDSTAAGATNVRYVIHGLRDRLEPGRPRRTRSSFVVTRGRGYTLDLARINLDVEDFESAARRGLTATGADGLASLERAAEYYRGDFLADEPFADWALDEKDRLRAVAERVLRRLVALKREAGDALGALAHLERLVELDPFDTSVQRELLALYLHSGRRGEAHRRYALLRRRMLASFGEEPEFRLADVTDAP